MDKEGKLSDLNLDVELLKSYLSDAHEFLQIIPDAVILVDSSNIIRQVNNEFYDLFGYMDEELVKADVGMIFSNEKEWSKIKKSNEPIYIEQILVKKNGNKFLGNVHFHTFLNTKGKTKGYSLIIKNLTDEKNKQKELEFQSMLLNNIQDFITATDLSGNIIYVNEAECKMFKKSRNELLSMNVKEFGEDTSVGVTQQEILNETLIEGSWRGKVANFTSEGRRIIYETRTQLLYDAEGNPVSMVGISTDITEREKAVEVLAENEEFYHTIFDQSAVGIAQLTREGRHIRCNELYCEITGYSINELQQYNFHDLTWQDDVRKEQGIISEVAMQKPATLDYEKRIEQKDGRLIWVHVYVNIVRNEEDKAKYVLVSLIDITRQKKNSERLLNLSTRLTLAAESAEMGIWEYDNIRKKLLLDDRMLQLYGYKKYDFDSSMESWKQRVHPDDRERVFNEIEKAMTESGDLDTSFKVIWPDKSVHHVKAYALVEKAHGKVLRLTGVTYDITEAWKAEQKIKSALAEKNTLLRELYHRTKNNMQVISSMLDLEAFSNEDENVRRTFKEMGDRIQTMSMVHHKLYQSQNLSEIDLGTYLSELSELLLKGSYHNGQKVKILTELEPVDVQIDTAIPCGLIINELISNSLKYAFHDRDEGEIKIKLYKKDKMVHLQYRDNGCGVPSGFDLERDVNLGLLLVNKLSRNQLHGETRFDLEGGFGFETRFNDEYYKESI